ncbi:MULTISPECIES: hypothetical protein [Pseudomonas]|uniref:hypothetical protein n=1 Tax=Pseudomonas TaxID=286 RepID=UPI000A4ADE77|nr:MULTISPECIES: hypothetical protein [Pseudomonas]AZC39324.1 hypothetical protein C4K37_4959 [Pseudomonas chlororaphis subsp. piscium]AZC45875.1 hypothetical protein C4K36_4972 [Pseudomonas chlororaphis subsp. piscium]AZC52608.1 hypothetical protein C4K35_5047 [Pseudomonas chlororaphis subsp. piscium]AZC58983.1 hypothetical protein C4K34_4840 [Pseudomonas chlororaphis subsp. piscium]AZC65191.1 hypothetical protein C4K33_4721 [Pseudomonas chlororaphis subsp. piscium]
MENTGILHAGQMTDPANNTDTETGLKDRFLKYQIKIGFQGQHEEHGVQRNQDQVKALRN